MKKWQRPKTLVLRWQRRILSFAYQSSRDFNIISTCILMYQVTAIAIFVYSIWLLLLEILHGTLAIILVYTWCAPHDSQHFEYHFVFCSHIYILPIPFVLLYCYYYHIWIWPYKSCRFGTRLMYMYMPKNMKSSAKCEILFIMHMHIQWLYDYIYVDMWCEYWQRIWV